MTPETMAEIVAQAIDVATAPIVARLAVTEAKLLAYESVDTGKSLVDVRERMAVQETRLEPLLTKVAELDARPWATKDLWREMEASFVEFKARLSALESRAPVPGPAGPQGEIGPAGPPGPSGAKGDTGERGKDGADGLNGKDGAPGPRGADGANGKDGADGVNGKDGAPGPRGEKGADGLNGKDGINGLDGKDGAPGAVGAKGIDGRDGQHGVGISAALIDRDGHLVFTLTDGSTKSCGVVVGKDGAPGLNGKDADTASILQTLTKQIESWERPKDGKDGAPGLNGKDGLGFDDFSLLFDEVKGYRLLFKRADTEREFPIAATYYAGIWQPGRSYVKGASVTHKGSTFTAIEETHGASPEESRVWRLSAKRGRDGKDGKDGKNGGDE